jgi:hypothetical protein
MSAKVWPARAGSLHALRDEVRRQDLNVAACSRIHLAHRPAPPPPQFGWIWLIFGDLSQLVAASSQLRFGGHWRLSKSSLSGRGT